MKTRMSVIIAMTLGLALCAFAATTASAEQRAWTCAPGSGEFADAHCATKTTGSFSAVNIANGTATEITATNEKTASSTTASTIFKLKAVLVGVAAEVQCKLLKGTGSLTNAASSVSGSWTIGFTGCTMNPSPCVVTGGGFSSNTLTVTTLGQASGTLKFSPTSGTAIASIPISGTGCSIPPASYPLTGSFIAAASGATLTTTHVATTAQGTLFLGGVKAGIESALTVNMTAGNPIFLR